MSPECATCSNSPFRSWGALGLPQRSLSARALVLFFLIVCGLLTVLILIPVWLRARWYGFHNYDLGIYSQAVRLLSFSDPNPWLTVRHLRVFNDHFDPILFVVAPIARLISPDFAVILFEHLMVLAAPVVLLAYVQRRCPDLQSFAMFAVVFLLFNRGALSNLNFPAHPSTWSGLPIILLGLACRADRRRAVFASLVFLFAFREEFPFSGLMLGAAYLVRRDWRTAAPVLALSCGWALAVFVARPRLLGETMNYGPSLLSGFFHDPGGKLGRLMAPGHWFRLVQCLAPLCPAAVWLIRDRLRPNWPMLAAAVPMFAIRALAGAWQFHYMLPVSACVLVGLLPRKAASMPKGVLLAGIVLTFAGSLGPLTKGARFYAAPTAGMARLRVAGRLRALDEARAEVLARREGKILAEGNIVPRLVERPEIYQFGEPEAHRGFEYRFVLLEKPPFGDPWPKRNRDVESLMERCRQTGGARIIRDDQHIFFAEGRFFEESRRRPARYGEKRTTP